MKILQTPTRFYPHIGGTEQVAYHLSQKLIKKGHQVKVICAEDEPQLGNTITDNITVKRLPFIGRIANTEITLSLPKVLLKEDFEVIHTHLPHPWSADISALVSLIRKKPLFLSYYNDIIGQGANNYIAQLYNLTALKFLLNRSHKIFLAHPKYIETSPFLKPFTEKIVIAPLGVDLDKFKSQNEPEPSECPSIFFLSCLDKFHKYKGLEYLLLSIKKIIAKIPLKLYIGGDGELLEYYQGLVKDNGLEKVVFFLGRLTDEQVIAYFNSCDVFTLPSISAAQEGFGLVAVEAMACKKPLIVSEIVGTAKDVKEHQAGIVIPPKDVDALAQALEYILTNKSKAQEMGNNGYQLVINKYNWENHANIVEAEYLKTI